MNSHTVADTRLAHPDTVSAFRRVRQLVAVYVGLSVLSLAAIVLLRDTAAVDDAVWTRGITVAASSLVTLALTLRAARGSARAFRRIRIIAVVMLVAIAVIIALPGELPLRMKLEQGVCALLLLGVAVLVNGRHLRSVFARA